MVQPNRIKIVHFILKFLKLKSFGVFKRIFSFFIYEGSLKSLESDILNSLEN